ncbi:hypothetical protein CLAFUW4_01343 [Fulvia fulva]|uniref:Uncharacterized protein n=1 Tax=Passalora fulva TaxID=5499 RepID=A0A9Q8L8R1_PASFU|nr:uncharacterized protein CLAFUR5_01348 [Fulvia fulva]KAK4635857.1 hypothetical protein CLAFUR4_01344 [Fulvia fulva]KAK4638281.1 hypothetical protein CLAFUR0_01345 [Fulvia fulva]UJO12889.1 hypothetical protein CLAFUR5_01348 [Fulvia fulva]WPV10060.1 hypothetical protein CLAFUW4_01343 [Fulvia fulva]WPV23158.1 hypothetical protein CLAFUW7_01348 [Fulvia fulva]
MFSTNNDAERRLDYFTVVRPNYNHYSVETPCCSPSLNSSEDVHCYPEHPLLASPDFDSHLLESPAPKMSANLMSLQTAAAHGHSKSRPRPYPMQNVLYVSSDDSSGSDSRSSSISPMTPVAARCSRCQRTNSVDLKTGKSNMVSYGLNLWYCGRCATLVGLNKG